MVGQYFLSPHTANFSLNYFVPFFQGQHLILSYSHSRFKVFPFLPASRWVKQMPCEELSGTSGPCQADARLPVSLKPWHFLLAKWKKMGCSMELGTEMSYQALLLGECGSARFSPGAAGGWGRNESCSLFVQPTMTWGLNKPAMGRIFGQFPPPPPPPPECISKQKWSRNLFIFTSSANLKLEECYTHRQSFEGVKR